MAEYKGIHGTKIQNYTTDPANPITGQVWYNETSQTMKVESVTTVGAWSTANDMNSTLATRGGAGTQTSALCFGGTPPESGATESYDGTTWTNVSSLNTAGRLMSGAGADNTAVLAFCRSTGSPGGATISATTESWNGSAWTEVNDLNTARNSGGGSGTQTSALAYGGDPSTAVTESWNGTSWTEVNDLNTARYYVAAAGADNTSALAFGGNVAPTAQTELWNGTSWTEVNDLNTGRERPGGNGIATAALASGGYAPSTATTVGFTEVYNGTSWSEDGDLNTVRFYPGAGGTTGAAVVFSSSPASAATEEWTGAGAPQVRTITSS